MSSRAPIGTVHDVDRDRFVSASPREIERRLSPRALRAWEGSFEATTVTEDGDATLVTATGPGISFRLRFEELADGYRYEQVGDGPFERMETRVTVTAEDEGSRVRARSRVSLALPVLLADRLGAWKRGGELDRLLDGLVAAV
jgi:hypothetical protein